MDGSSWRLFDRVAADYDQVVPFFAEYGAAIVAALDPPPGCRFLDVGAGRGALTAPALARGCVVTAVDAAPGMVGRLAAFVIHILDDPAAGVAEAFRVLAPGGQLGFTGSSARSGSGHGSTAAEPPSLGDLLDALFIEFTPCLRPGEGMGRPVDAADLLTEAGFVDIREDRAEVSVRFPDNAVLWRWAMSHGYRAFVEDLPADRRREFHKRVLELSGNDRVLRRATGVWSGRKPR